jgi:hypothetical protein
LRESIALADASELGWSNSRIGKLQLQLCVCRFAKSAWLLVPVYSVDGSAITALATFIETPFCHYAPVIG